MIFWECVLKFCLFHMLLPYMCNLAVIKLLLKLLLNTKWTLICFGSQTVKSNLGWTSKQSFTVIYQIVPCLKGRAMILTSLILHSIFTRFPSWFQICWSYGYTISFPISLSKVLEAQNIIQHFVHYSYVKKNKKLAALLAAAPSVFLTGHMLSHLLL